MNKFDMTLDGCTDATDYLASVDKLEEFNNNKTSVDGYSLVAFANSVFENSTVVEDGVIIES